MKAEKMKTVVVCVDPKAGVTMASSLDEKGEVVKGKARCVGGDEFRPEIGAIIALCKAMGVQPVKACYDVLNVYAKDSAKQVLKAEVKEHKKEAKVRRKTMKGTCVGMLRKGRGVLKAVGLLAGDKAEHYGVMGELTNFYDKNGKRLHVGDLVTVEVLEGDVRTGRKWKSVPGLTFVVDEHSDDPVSKGAYIMGMMKGCDPKTGKIDKRFRIKLAKTWQEVEIGEVHSSDQIMATWEWEDKQR